MKRAANITDRAKRYRAKRAASAIKMGRRCHYCGNPKAKLEVEHVDGVEANTKQKNLGLSCHSCNALKSIAFKTAGLGERTKQYNPAKVGAGPPAAGPLAKGARTWQEWAAVTATLKGKGHPQRIRAARDIVLATPHARRAEFAAELYRYAKNPQEKGAQSFEQWGMAVAAIDSTRPRSRSVAIIPIEEARKIIADTPKFMRDFYQSQAWTRRREVYGRSGRQRAFKFDGDEVPF